ncbi:hypothetical protein ES703_78640 [subsurface metagenome]
MAMVVISISCPWHEGDIASYPEVGVVKVNACVKDSDLNALSLVLAAHYSGLYPLNSPGQWIRDSLHNDVFLDICNLGFAAQ